MYFGSIVICAKTHVLASATSSSGTTTICSSCTVPATKYFFAVLSIPSVITHLATPCVTLLVIFPEYSLVSSAPYVHCNLPFSSLLGFRSGYSRLMPEGSTISPFLNVTHLWVYSLPSYRLY